MHIILVFIQFIFSSFKKHLDLSLLFFFSDVLPFYPLSSKGGADTGLLKPPQQCTWFSNSNQDAEYFSASRHFFLLLD